MADCRLIAVAQGEVGGMLVLCCCPTFLECTPVPGPMPVHFFFEKKREVGGKKKEVGGM
jgi:hypothetical protein